jgi:hypothetical protein
MPSTSFVVKPRQALAAGSTEAGINTTLVSRTPNNAPANVRGVNIFYTRNGYMRIWLVVDAVGSTFSELFQSEGTGRAIANDIGQHFVQTIKDTTVPGQENGFLALEAPTAINIIYDAAEAGQYTGSIAVDVDATSHQNFPEFLDQIWNQFIRATEQYWRGFDGVDVTVRRVDDIGQVGQDITQLPTRSIHQRDLLDQQVCAKPVDLRPAIAAQIPNWNLQQPYKTHC